MQNGTTTRLKMLVRIALIGLVGFSLRAATHQEKPTYKITGGEATLTGTISFVGTAPKPKRIDMSADPVCKTRNPDSSQGWGVIVKNHKLADVLVYVRGERLDNYSFDASSPDVTLEHNRCRYLPHVLGMQVQQTLLVVNRDQTMHNTHPVTISNPETNRTQMPGGTLQHRFTVPELYIPIKCNQHPWERAIISVFPHPFFSVSGTDGSYEISGLPPGQYTVVAWHEKLGEQTVDLFVGGSEKKTLDFTFKERDP